MQPYLSKPLKYLKLSYIKRDRACSTPTTLNSFGASASGAIVNKILINLEKTTSSVLSVILINLWFSPSSSKDLGIIKYKSEVSTQFFSYFSFLFFPFSYLRPVHKLYTYLLQYNMVEFQTSFLDSYFQLFHLKNKIHFIKLNLSNRLFGNEFLEQKMTCLNTWLRTTDATLMTT